MSAAIAVILQILSGQTQWTNNTFVITKLVVLKLTMFCCC